MTERLAIDVVDKYIGDALMALFGAPPEMRGQASQALATALEMRAALYELNQQLFSGKGYALGFGIGIHTDAVVAGNIGSPQRHGISRKRLQARGDVHARLLGEVPVKGKEQLVTIHALLGRN